MVAAAAPAAPAAPFHGLMPPHNPILGNFQHAPSARNARFNKYFRGEIVSRSEYERLKALRHNPFTGQFHTGPNRFSRLHGLKRFRRSRPTNDTYKIDDDDSMSGSGSDVPSQLSDPADHGETSWFTDDFYTRSPAFGDAAEPDNADLLAPPSSPRVTPRTPVDALSDLPSIGLLDDDDYDDNNCHNNNNSDGGDRRHARSNADALPDLAWADESSTRTGLSEDVAGFGMGMDGALHDISARDCVRAHRSRRTRSLEFGQTDAFERLQTFKTSPSVVATDDTNTNADAQQPTAHHQRLASDSAAGFTTGPHFPPSASEATGTTSLRSDDSTTSSVTLGSLSSANSCSSRSSSISASAFDGPLPMFPAPPAMAQPCSVNEGVALDPRRPNCVLTAGAGLILLGSSRLVPRRSADSNSALAASAKDYFHSNRVFRRGSAGTYEQSLESRSDAPPRHTISEPVSAPETLSNAPSSLTSEMSDASSTTAALEQVDEVSLIGDGARFDVNLLKEEEGPSDNPWIVNRTVGITTQYQINMGKSGSLGKGAYSVVKLGTQRTTGGEFAIKIVKKRLLVSGEEKDMIRREVELHQVLRHRHVVRLHEIYEDEARLFLVLERTSAGTLESHIRNSGGRLPEAHCQHIFRQLLHALAYLHDNGVLQGDLKPPNVLLTHRKSAAAKLASEPSFCVYDIKICDFGLSRKVPDVKYYRHTGDVHKVPYTDLCGTMGYVAPEILSRQPYTVAVDIWAAGIILYEMLGGIRPFVPYRDCLTVPLEFPAPVFGDVTSSATRLLSSLLKVDPVLRPTARKALHDPWIANSLSAVVISSPQQPLKR